MQVLLGCAYQSTANSSNNTRLAARGLASALGASYWEFDVQKFVDQYLEMGELALGRKMDWQQDDIALQNVQARVRGPGIWLLANLRKAILLTTSNRSEAAVGYATMDGDTCGGLAPLAGIDKAFLREWLKWAEASGSAECGPLPCLALVNSLAPAAELRPLSAAQTDERDLMPYDVLDAIEQLAIRDKRSPHETCEIMQARLSGRHSATEVQAWVAKFFRLWAANQWKRERYAPCFHLDDENLDPKTWCRFPILSGAYRRELRELEKDD